MANQTTELWRRVNRHVIRPYGPKHCHQWIGASWGSGRSPSNMYGCMNIDGDSLAVHRVIYELERGKIPPGMVVMHTCDNPRCVNLAHLQVGTQRDNVQDMIRKGRQRTGRRCSHS